VATKLEVLKGLSDELNKAYEDSDACFGREYDAKDDTCIKTCSDGEACKLLTEADPDPVEAESVEAPSTEEGTSKVESAAQESSQQNSDPIETTTKEDTPVADEKKAPEAEVAEGTTEAATKPKGFGDRTAKKDPYGFTEGTKGSFIALLLAKAPITKADMLAQTNEKFGTDSSGRINMVMYKMRDRGFKLIRAGKKYFLEGVTPEDLIAVAVKEAEAAEAAKTKAKAAKPAEADAEKPIPEEKPAG